MLALGVTAVPLVVAALLCAGATWRRCLAVLVASPALVVPVVWPETLPIARLVTGIFAAAGVARVFEMSREPSSRSLGARVVQAITIVDWRTARRATARVETRQLLSALGLHAVAGAAIGATIVARVRHVSGAIPLGWALGALAVWAYAEGGTRFLTSLVAALGWRVAKLHDHPARSTTLAEMWSQRWNLTVSRYLRTWLFAPLVRSGHPTAGLFVAFLGSALLHAYIAFAAGGVRLMWPMTAFFVGQGVLVIIERAAGVKRWPRHVARAWFFVAMLVPSPLFVEPMIAIVWPRASFL